TVRRLWLGEASHAADAHRRFQTPSLQLPALLIFEVAMARRWMRKGVQPSALIGHSMGENAAACIAGVIRFDEAVALVHLRGKLFEETGDGAMLSVAASRAAIEELLPDNIDVATVNAPDLCSVSGPREAITQFGKTLADVEIDAVAIPIDVAAHSRMLSPILGHFREFLGGLNLKAPRIPIISNLSGEWLSDARATDPDYWVEHLRNPVLFSDGLATLAQSDRRVFIEVGPQRTLSSLLKQQPQIEANRVLHSLPHPDEGESDELQALRSLGEAWSLGLPVENADLGGLDDGVKVSLPRYAFDSRPFFLERVAATRTQADEDELIKKPDIADWGWKTVWRPRYADIASDETRESKRFIVFFADSHGVADLTAQRLRAQGHRVVMVSPGDRYEKLAEDEYVICPEAGKEGYVALFRQLSTGGAAPGEIAHFWLMTGDESHRPGSSFFNRMQECGIESLLWIAVALSQRSDEAPVKLTVFANGVVQVRDEALPYPEKATVLGATRVIPRELAGVDVALIDVSPDRTLDRRSVGGINFEAVSDVLGLNKKSVTDIGLTVSVDVILDELNAPTACETVAYRFGKRWVEDYGAIKLAESKGETASRFRQNGTYVFTGGHGDIALALAERLASRYRANIVLIGRRPLPDAERRAAYLAQYGEDDRVGGVLASIAAIERSGGTVLDLTADVADPEVLGDALEQATAHFGRLDGVFHTAGVLRDNLIPLKELNEIEEVFAPKVIGGRVLCDVMADRDSDFVVLFSSTSTATSPVGQIDYVGANAYLNALARSRAGSTGPRIVSVNWGVWGAIGLAARTLSGETSLDTNASIEPARQPLFDRVMKGGAASMVAEYRCSTENYWILDQHRLKGGEPVFPGTGYLELFAEAAVEYGLLAPFELSDVFFQKPLFLRDGETRAMRVMVSEIDRKLKCTVESRAETTSGIGAAWECHAEAVVQKSAWIDGRLDRASLDDAQVVAGFGEGIRETLEAAQGSHLQLGPQWSVLRQIRRGTDCMFARLQLGDFGAQPNVDRLILHPGLLDMATGYAMDLIEGYNPADGLWAPISYGSITVARALPDR
ncbi:MAG: SDR family oxidoreductase, partial [Pseudomonadota bacterium]